MQAISIDTASRTLYAGDVPAPGTPPPGHVVVDIEACGINPGDKTFLTAPDAAGGVLNGSNTVWGASGAGKVCAIGVDVPQHFLGRHVAVYRSLGTSTQTIGLWCEQAQVPCTSCVILPDHVSARDYGGSLVNAITAYAFLQQSAADGHRGVIATAGASATALALAVLATRRRVPVIHLVRSETEQKKLRALGIEYVLVTNGEDFEAELGQLAETLQATAVFDGLGGPLIGRIAPHVPMNTTIYLYGFLDAAAPMSMPSRLFMSKNLVMRRFSNFNSATVKNPKNLAAAMADLHDVIGDPLFRTRIGMSFGFCDVDAAMAYEGAAGARAILVPSQR